MIDYNKRLVEVDEILNHLSKEDYNKIPEIIKKSIKDNKDKEYFWKYDTNKKLKEQDVSDDTIAILSYINMEYLLNQKQKEFVEKLHEKNEKEIIYEKSYNTDIFENNSFVANKQELLVEKPKESFLRKITKFIGELFSKNK